MYTIQSLADAERLTIQALIDRFSAESCQLALRGMAAGTLTLTMPVDKTVDSLLHLYGRRYVVSDGGRIVINGHVSDIRPSAGADSLTAEITITDDWWYLDNVQYVDMTDVTSSSDSDKAPDTPIDVTVLTDRLDNALRWTPVKLRSRLTGQVMDDKADFCRISEIVANITKWLPNATSCWEWDGGDQYLVLADGDDLPAVTLSLDNGDVVGDINLTARHDLVPTGVCAVINYDSREVQPAKSEKQDDGTVIYSPEYSIIRHRSSVIYPDNVRMTDAGVYVYNVSSAAWPYIIPGAPPSGGSSGGNSGEAISTGTTEFTKKAVFDGVKIPDVVNENIYYQYVRGPRHGYGTLAGAWSFAELPDHPLAKFKGYRPLPTDYIYYSSRVDPVIPDYMVDYIAAIFQYTPWLEYTVVRCDVPFRRLATGSDSEEIQLLFPDVKPDGYRYGYDSAEMILVRRDRNVAALKLDKTGVYSDVSYSMTNTQREGVWRQACRNYYDQTRLLPFDGSVPVAGRRYDLHGMALNLSGGDPAWMSMRSPVVAVDIDYATDQSHLQLGVKTYLGIDNALTRQASLDVDQKQDEEPEKETQQAQDQWEFDPRTSAVPGPDTSPAPGPSVPVDPPDDTSPSPGPDDTSPAPGPDPINGTLTFVVDYDDGSSDSVGSIWWQDGKVQTQGDIVIRIPGQSRPAPAP